MLLNEPSRNEPASSSHLPIQLNPPRKPGPDRFANTGIKLLFLLMLLIVVAVGAMTLGGMALSSQEIMAVFLGRGDALSRTILFNLRLPRIVLGILVGVALGTAGAAYQALFRNPLADPFVVGASSGAAFGASLVIVMGWSVSALGFGPTSLGSFAGALGAVGLVYLVAAVGRMPPVALLLAGTVVSTILGAGVWLMLALADSQIHRIVGWLMGGLAGRGWDTVITGTFPVVLATGVLCCLGRPLDAICCGPEMARGLGLRVGTVSAIVMGAASLSIATAVASSGIIGFVGLVAPHLARPLVGASHVGLIPASGLIGAILLMAADACARSVLSPLEIPIGVVTALLGGPFFLVVLHREARQKQEGTG